MAVMPRAMPLLSPSAASLPRARRWRWALLAAASLCGTCQAQPLLPTPEAATVAAPRTAGTSSAAHPCARLTLEVHEALLNRIAGRSEQRQSAVRDFVLGADVYGVEITATRVQIDLLPSANAVALNLVLHGENHSDTVGYTPQAAVRTLGVNSFTATKFVLHDGRLFHTRRPRVTVAPYNQTIGVDTPVSGVPLLGPLASSIAFQAAQAQRPAGEAITAQKISTGVGGEFNRNIDRELARLNRGWLDAVAPQLQRVGLGDVAIEASSTDQWARYAVRIAAPASVSPVGLEPHQPSTMTDAAGPGPGVVGRLSVHAHLLNQLLDRLPLQGVTLRADEIVQAVGPGSEWMAVIERLGIEVPQRPVEAIAGLRNLSLRFDAHEPLRVSLLNDEFRLALRAALSLPPVIESPLLRIEIRYTLDASASDELVLTPGGISFQPAEPGAPGLGPLGNLLETQSRALLPPVRIRRRVTVPVPDSEPVAVQVRSLRARDDWLELSVE